MQSDKMVEVPEALIEDICYHLSGFDESRSRANAGYHLIELYNSVGDLASYHSGYDSAGGTIPHEQETDED